MFNLTKTSSFLLLLLGVSALSTTACSDDDLDPREETNNRLQGDWTVESYRVDGEELLLQGSAFDMEFEKEDPFSGEFEWNISEITASLRIRGDYEIESGGDEIELEGDQALQNVNFDIEIDGDELELEGTVNNQRWEIQAERD